jgi:polyisoprenyl-phosphate glycosyltransferase
MNKLISLITPTYNEESNIEKLCLDIASVMNNSNYRYEHIVIDNSSTDQTIPILRKLSLKDKNLKIIINARNFGHIRSPIHGMLQAKGEALILMNSDFQDPVFLIPEYIKEWENGNKVVMAQKISSDEDVKVSFIRKVFYKFIKKISEVSLPTNTTGSGLYDREIIEKIREINDPYPYFRGLIPEITNDVKLLPFHQPERLAGKTKNNLYTLYDIGILGIIKHSKIPLRFFTFIGLATSIISLLVAIIFFIRKLLDWESFTVGIAPLIIGFFFIASLQIFLLGFIGEYVMNILTYSRKMPLVVEKERINF